MRKPRWWEIEICCRRGSQAEVLGRVLGVGFAFCIPQPGGDRDRVRAYLPEDRGEPSRFAATMFSLQQQAREEGTDVPELRWRLIDSWTLPDADKEQWPAREVGERLLVLPEWAPVPSEADRTIVRIDPRWGFGDAGHPTTAWLLETLERRLGDVGYARKPVLADIGCGSGILALAAIALGAGKVHAVDTDLAAVEGTRLNAELNNVAADRLVVTHGSVGELAASLAEPVDGFCCNMPAAIVLEVIADIGGITHDRTWGALTGFSERDAELVRNGLADQGWLVIGETRWSEWYCLEVRRAA